MTQHWYETHDNLVGLAEWLNSECCAFRTVSDVIYFFEKPWKWTREYGIWQLWAKADTPVFRELCIEAVYDEKTTADGLQAQLEERNGEE